HCVWLLIRMDVRPIEINQVRWGSGFEDDELRRPDVCAGAFGWACAAPAVGCCADVVQFACASHGGRDDLGRDGGDGESALCDVPFAFGAVVLAGHGVPSSERSEGTPPGTAGHPSSSSALAANSVQHGGHSPIVGSQ